MRLKFVVMYQKHHQALFGGYFEPKMPTWSQILGGSTIQNIHFIKNILAQKEAALSLQKDSFRFLKNVFKVVMTLQSQMLPKTRIFCLKRHNSFFKIRNNSFCRRDHAYFRILFYIMNNFEVCCYQGFESLVGILSLKKCSKGCFAVV